MLVAMKRYFDLAGKGLAGAGLTGIVAYVVGTATHQSWPYWLFGGMVAAGGVIYLLGQSRTAPRSATAIEASGETADTRPAPIFTSRWRHTLNGHEVPGLMMITHKGFSHHGYMRPSSERRPPSARFGVLVASEPLGPTPTTSALRECFLNFLASQPVSGLIDTLTYVEDDLSWMSYASNGRIHNEAVLVSGADQEDAPVVSAMLNLNEVGLAHYGHDSRTVELVLHIEVRDKDGDAAPPAEFRAWHEALVLALDVPRAFGRFLNQDLGLATYGEPPAQLSLELRARRGIAELIHTGSLPTVAGSSPSNFFHGYMVAEHHGGKPGDAAVEMLTSICDHTLHLHGYEDELDKLRTK